jgi:hypothetical protein
MTSVAVGKPAEKKAEPKEERKTATPSSQKVNLEGEDVKLEGSK